MHNNKLIRIKKDKNFKIKIKKMSELKNIKFKKCSMEKMDIVYTYVDSNDKNWKKNFSNYVKKNVNEVRYKDYEEIYFSLKTLIKFAKNVFNNIYIVTASQKLNDEKLKKLLTKEELLYLCAKLKYIYHKDIIPNKYLPTFNSITIETFLHKIPNISENFVYINDDVFFGNYLSNNFFYDNETPIIFLRKIYKASNKSPDKPWLDYYLNVYDLFKNKYNIFPNYAPLHTHHIINKKVCKLCWENFDKEITDSLTRVRESKNINFWFLNYAMGIYRGYFKVKMPKITESINITCHPGLNKKEREKDLMLIFENKPLFYCYNNITDECDKYWNILRENYFKLFDNMIENNLNNNIKLVSLNILAHQYTNFTRGDKYKKESVHEMRLRYIKLYKVLKEINADIYCLQEVDQIANKYLSLKFKKNGYNFNYVYNDLNNGLLILWRDNNRLLGINKKIITKDYDIKNKSYPIKKQLCQLVNLQINEKNLTIINTRLWGHPDRVDVRLDELDSILNIRNKEENSIICGDFNETDYEKIRELVNNKYSVYDNYFLKNNFATSYHPWNLNRDTKRMYEEPLNHKYKNVDYLLYSKNIIINNFESYPTKKGIYNIEEPYKDKNTKYDMSKWMSDHALLLFYFSINK